MAFTYEISTEHNIYPNLTVYDRFSDGVAAGWKVEANEGYVFYDENAEDMDAQIDPETGDLVIDPETGLPVMVPVTYYYTEKGLSKYYNWANFALVAVLRSTVPENMIFGGGDNDHEVM